VIEHLEALNVGADLSVGELLVRLMSCAAMLGLSGSMRPPREMRPIFIETAERVFDNYAAQLGVRKTH
jgi:hypothetical protein